MVDFTSLKLGLAALVLSSAASAAAVLPPLSENTFINNWLLAAAIGDEIRKNCPTISPRLLRVYTKAKELESHALGLGYSQEQTDAYIDSKQEQARMKARRDAYLEAKGAVAGDADSYCVLGREEIEKNTQIGWLLYEK